MVDFTGLTLIADMNQRYRIVMTALLVLLMSSCKEEKGESGSQGEEAVNETNTTPKLLTYTFIRAVPHDTSAFTEGLLVHEGQLFESTGSPEDMPTTRSLFGI